MDINRYIDHTVLKAITSIEDIKILCKEAIEYNFYSVCVNGSYVKDAKRELKGTEVKIAAVVGFPLGAMTKKGKVYEAKDAIKNGADEIDMVINVGYVKSGRYDEVYKEIKAIKKIIGKKVLKVIIETCYLDNDEKIKICKLAVKAKADFVKTSTGFGTDGASIEDVELMKKAVNGKAKIKASGGIRDFETAKKYIEIGVERLGTSSGVNIMNNEQGAGY